MSGIADIINDSLEAKVDCNQATASPLGHSDLVVDPPPDGGYGWVCVASVFIVNGFTWGVTAVRSSAKNPAHQHVRKPQ